jgi:voltage-gated potassium channel
MFEALLVSVVLVAITVVIHAYGTHHWMRYMGYRFIGADGDFKPRKVLQAIISTAVTLLMLHLVEVIIWAVAYRALNPISSLDTFEKAMYFSVVTFTTLGYGDITLPEHEWRIMSGIEALNGIVLVGWTTAFLFAVVQRSWSSTTRGK